MKLNDLIPLFVDIVTDDKFKTLGSPYTYQLADEINTNVISKNVMEVDIKSAFPTICKLMYGEENDFVQKIFNIQDKIERNKFIAITLKQLGDRDGRSYLSDLNLWSKILTMGYIYSKYKDIVVLQYIKDGVIFIATQKNNLEVNCNTFIDYIIKNNIVFHERQLDIFMRFNHTSIVVVDKKISVKGDYHSLPSFIQNTVLPNIFDGNAYDHSFFHKVKQIYSDAYGKILLNASLLDEVKDYYEINGKYLNSVGKHDSLTNINPLSYLRYIVYPVLSLCRLNQNNV